MDINFSGRPPSGTWERISLADSPQSYVWVWFKPPNVPQGLVVRIPVKIFQNYPHLQLRMRKILQAVGVKPSCVSMWSLYGTPYEAQNGTSPYLDSAIPEPVAAAEPNIVVCIDTPHVETT